MKFTMFTVWGLIFLISLGSCSQKEKIDSEAYNQKFNEFLDSSFEEGIAYYPTWQTYLGRRSNYGKLNNATEEFQKEEIERTKKSLKSLRGFDFDRLGESEQLSYKIYEHSLLDSIEGYKWRYHDFPLNQMFGYHSTIPSFLINMHQVKNEEEAKAYISRLKEIKRFFGEMLAFLKKQEQKGMRAPHFVYAKVLDEAKNFITGQPFSENGKENSLLEDFKKKVSTLKISEQAKKKLVAKASQELLTSVKPAYDELIAYVENISMVDKGSHGVWSLPNGDEYYQFKLKQITTTDLTPKQIHEIGLSEVNRIHNEMKALAKKVGFKGTLKEFFAHVKKPEFRYPNTPNGRKAYLKKTGDIIENMEKELPNFFLTLPKADLEVKAVEPYREKTAGIAFYNGPSMEGDRPGIYYVNLFKMEDNPKYKMEALAYHEAVPGHHMQIAIATELGDLPKFRRLSGFTAYTEGWGLYAELLPKEMGFYQDPYSDFGRLSLELWRACRLVVDTGIHYKKWSRKKAIDYLSENTPSGDLEIEKGVERYFIYPGQATAYKVGMMKILDLRKNAKMAMGDKFDIRKFHDVILAGGAMPLSLLEDRVNMWLRQTSE